MCVYASASAIYFSFFNVQSSFIVLRNVYAFDCVTVPVRTEFAAKYGRWL